MWFACGENSVVDGCMVIATRAAEHGVTVVLGRVRGHAPNSPTSAGLGSIALGKAVF